MIQTTPKKEEFHEQKRDEPGEATKKMENCHKEK